MVNLNKDNEGVEGALAIFQENVPEHDCPRDESCAAGDGFYLTYSSPKDVHPGVVAMGVHHMDTPQIVTVLVNFLDSVAQGDYGPEVPPMARWARGRELMKRALETTPPPGEVGMDGESLLRLLFEGPQSDD